MAHSHSSNSQTAANVVHDEHDHAYFSHPMPVYKLLGVFVALVTLTILTVAVSDLADVLHLGRFEIWISLGIATIKAGLVIFFFMHLLHDKPFNQMLFFATFFFVAMFIGITLMDTEQYAGDVKSYEGEVLPARKVGGELVEVPWRNAEN